MVAHLHTFIRSVLSGWEFSSNKSINVVNLYTTQSIRIMDKKCYYKSIIELRMLCFYEHLERRK